MLFPKLGGRLFGGRARPPLFRLSVDRFAPGALVSALGGTFTRASTATYRDQNGVIQTAASGVARDNHYELDPVSNTYVRTLLLEGSRTNICTWSVPDVANWGRAAANATENALVAPDGTSTATKLTANAVDGLHGTYKNLIGTVGQPYTASVFLKKNGYDYGFLRIDALFLFVDLNTGAIAGSVGVGIRNVTVTPFPNGWFRISGTVTYKGTDPNMFFGGCPTPSASYTGDGLSGAYCWGAQLELAEFASSYIPTTSAAVTRQGDNLSFPWGNAAQSLSVFMRGGIYGPAPSNPRFFQIGTDAVATPADTALLTFLSGANTINAGTRGPDGVFRNTSNGPAISAGQVYEFSTTLAQDGATKLEASVNSASATTLSVSGAAIGSGAPPRLYLYGSNGSAQLSGYFRDLVVVKGTKSLDYFRALITDDLAAYDADAKALVKRAVSSGATLVGPSGTDHRSFLNSFISALKNGGSAGDCYALIDAMYLPILSIRDSANKVSKLLDGAKQKGTSFGTGGYYDASQTTGSLQQTLTRGDNKGNLVKYSEDATNAIWVKGAVTTATGSNTPSGKASVRVAGDATIVSHQVYQQLTFTQDRGYTFEFLVKSQPCQFVQILAGSGQFGTQAFANFDIVNGLAGTKGTNCTSAIQNAGNGWWRVSMTATATASGTNSANLAFVTSASASRAQTMDGTGVALDVSESSFRESTWDSDYIATASAPIYAGLDGKPVLMFDASTGSNAGYSTVGTLESKMQPSTVFGVVRKDGGGANYRMWFDSKSGSNRNAIGFNNDTTQVVVAAGTAMFATTDQASWGQYSVRFNGSGSAIRRKGAQIAAGNAGTQAMATGIIIGNDFTPASPHNGPLALAISVRQPLTAAQLAHFEKTIAAHFPSIAPTIPAPSLAPVTDNNGQNITDHSGSTITN